LPYGTKKNKNAVMEKTKSKKIRNGPVRKSVESVLRLEGSLWWERLVKEIGFQAAVKE